MPATIASRLPPGAHPCPCCEQASRSAYASAAERAAVSNPAPTREATPAPDRAGEQQAGRDPTGNDPIYDKGDQNGQPGHQNGPAAPKGPGTEPVEQCGHDGELPAVVDQGAASTPPMPDEPPPANLTVA